MNRQRIIWTLVLIFLLSRAPVYISLLIHASNERKLIFAIMGSILGVCLPIYFSHKWEKYASFDKTLWTGGWQHYAAIPLYSLAMVTWGASIGYALSKIGWHRMTVELPPTLFGVNCLLLVILAPISEEVFWRGYAMDQFRKMVSPWTSLWLQAGLFALAHFPIQGMGAISALGLGVMLGHYRMRYGGLLPIIVCHCLLNLLSILPNMIDFIRHSNS